MRLLLSSARLETAPAALCAWATKARVGVIMNGLDADPDRRALRYRQQQALYAGLARSVEELDLRPYFAAPAELVQRMQRLDLISVNGGDTFVLRQAMARSGFDDSIRALLASDRIAYAGFSAGALVAGPSLRSLGFHDGPATVPPGYHAGKTWEGLGLLPQGLIVHYSAEDSASTAQRAYFEEAGLPFLPLENGQALLIDGDGSAPICISAKPA